MGCEFTAEERSRQLIENVKSFLWRESEGWSDYLEKLRWCGFNYSEICDEILSCNIDADDEEEIAKWLTYNKHCLVGG